MPQSKTKCENVVEEKFFTNITNLFSNNFYGGIYNLTKSYDKHG